MSVGSCGAGGSAFAGAGGDGAERGRRTRMCCAGSCFCADTAGADVAEDCAGGAAGGAAVPSCDDVIGAVVAVGAPSSCVVAGVGR